MALSSTDLWLAADDRIRPAPTQPVYLIGPRDVLTLQVKNHSEFNGQLAVDEKGEVVLPLLEETVLLEGLDFERAENIMAQWIAPYVQGSVTCRVGLVKTGSRFYYVLAGSLSRHPLGVDPVTVRDLLLDRSDRIALDTITVLRPDFTDRRRPRLMALDMSGVTKGLWDVDYRLRPNDVVVLNPNLKGRILGLWDRGEPIRHEEDWHRRLTLIESHLSQKTTP